MIFSHSKTWLIIALAAATGCRTPQKYRDMEYPERISVPETLLLLDRGNRQEKLTALKKLEISLAPEVVNAMIRCLGDPSIDVRIAAATSLRSFHDRRAVPPLIQRLRPDPRIEIREQEDLAPGKSILHFSGNFQAWKEILSYRGFVLAPDTRFRFPSPAHALSQQTQRYTIREEDGPDQYLMFRRPGSSDEHVSIEGDSRIVKHFAQRLKWGRPDEAAALLISLGETQDRRATPILVAHLEEAGHPEAALALGRIGDARAYVPLLQASQSVQPKLRRNATAGLAKLGDPRGSRHLASLLRDNDPEVRKAVCRHAHLYHCETLFTALLDALQDPDKAVQRAAVSALGRTGDTRAGSRILLEFQHADRNRQATIAEALAQLEHTEAYTDILNAYESTRSILHKTAFLEALAKLNPTQSAPLLRSAFTDGTPLVRLQAANNWIETQGTNNEHADRILDYLLRGYKAGATRGFVRSRDWGLLALLGNWPDTAIAEKLGAVLNDKSVPLIARRYAAIGLGRTGSSYGRKMLCEALEDSSVPLTRSILRALSEHDTNTCTTRIIPYLDHHNGNLRKIALSALRGSRDPATIAAVRALLEDTHLGVQAEAAQVLMTIDATPDWTTFEEADGRFNLRAPITIKRQKR